MVQKFKKVMTAVTISTTSKFFKNDPQRIRFACLIFASRETPTQSGHATQLKFPG